MKKVFLIFPVLSSVFFSAQKVDNELNHKLIDSKVSSNNEEKTTPKILRISCGLAANWEPLYVVDGKIIDDFDFKKIEPNFIESVSVLKDKNATALYGEKGKNGVIIIKTKQDCDIPKENNENISNT